MTDLTIHLEGGDLGFVQAMQLVRRIDELGKCHWHFNDCGCCVTVHGEDTTYVIGADGEETLYLGKGCDCD
jgi:hypothetical protein